MANPPIISDEYSLFFNKFLNASFILNRNIVFVFNYIAVPQSRYASLSRIFALLYSYRRASTGFRVAARQLCQPTAKKAIHSAKAALTKKYTGLIETRFAKCCNH